jgi:hypothetical protein
VNRASTAADPARLFWTAAVFIALTLHAAWLALLQPAMPGFECAAMPDRMSHIRFTPVGAAETPADARWLWAPVIFSLPASTGFGLAGPGGGVLQPPMHLPEDPPPLRARSATPPPPAVYAPAGVAPAAWPLIDRAPPPPPAASSMIALEPAAGADAWPFPLEARAAGPAPWRAVARVEFGADALPRSVLVEEGDAPEAVRAAVARALFAWRPAGVAPGGVVRLLLRHVPPAGEAAP